MYDSVTPAAVPADAVMVAGYVNGTVSQWSATAWSRWPHAVRVDVLGTDAPAASVLDVERGDATPEEARVWVPQRNSLYGDATVYCNVSTLPAVRAACAGQSYRVWLADWTGEPHDRKDLNGGGATVAAVQYANDVAGCDLSAVYDDAWHPQPAAPAPAAPGPWDERHLDHLVHARHVGAVTPSQEGELEAWAAYGHALEGLAMLDAHEDHVLVVLRKLKLIGG